MGPVEMSNADGPLSPRSGSGGRRKPFLIGVAGGTASGKSTVCERIIEEVTKEETGRKKQIVSLSQDSFYRELDALEQEQAERGMFNFDHPDAFDEELMLSCLTDIREGRNTRLPLYDYKKNARVKDQYILVEASDVVLFEGILVFYFKEVMGKFDLKLFVDTDDDTRLARRVLRDIEERGRNLEHVLHQYTELVKPAFEEFCLPTKKHADVIIPRGADNTVAISLVANHIKDIINRRSASCGSSSSRADSPLNRSRANSDSLGR